jgi:hypothetical protein
VSKLIERMKRDGRRVFDVYRYRKSI